MIADVFAQDPARDADVRDLRVLMLSDAVGGVFSYSVTLARALCASGASVYLVLQGPAASADGRAVLDGIAGLRVTHTDLALEWLDPDGADSVRARRTLASIAADVRPDVVHLCGYREALADFAAPVVIVAHSCVPTWWRACRGGAPDPSWDGYTRDLRAGLDAADAWMAPTSAHRDAVMAAHRPRRAGHVVPNGIEPRPPGASSVPLVLAAGRAWDEAKDFATLAAASSSITLPVAVAGPRSLDDVDPAPSNESAMAHLGALSPAALHARMGEARIFVSPAVYEPFGLGVLEAAGAGCALVLSDIPSFRELWDDAALFVTPRDPAALATAVNRLAGDASLRGTLRVRSLARARSFSAARSAAETAAVYRSVLDGQGARAPAREAVLA